MINICPMNIAPMNIAIPRLAVSGMSLVLVACASEPGEISRDTAAFDGVASEASITLLGTEPFWGIDIAPDGDGHKALYSTPDNIDGAAFVAERFAGNNGLGFNGELNGQAVQIAITQGECSDGMSDRSYPYTATVAIGPATLYGCGYTSDEPFSGEESP